MAVQLHARETEVRRREVELERREAALAAAQLPASPQRRTEGQQGLASRGRGASNQVAGDRALRSTGRRAVSAGQPTGQPTGQPPSVPAARRQRARRGTSAAGSDDE